MVVSTTRWINKQLTYVIDNLLTKLHETIKIIENYTKGNIREKDKIDNRLNIRVLCESYKEKKKQKIN